jgi:hypothetical protein
LNRLSFSVRLLLRTLTKFLTLRPIGLSKIPPPPTPIRPVSRTESALTATGLDCRFGNAPPGPGLFHPGRACRALPKIVGTKKELPRNGDVLSTGSSSQDAARPALIPCSSAICQSTKPLDPRQAFFYFSARAVQGFARPATT